MNLNVRHQCEHDMNLKTMDVWVGSNYDIGYSKTRTPTTILNLST
jgi:hypothetical protein